MGALAVHLLLLVILGGAVATAIAAGFNYAVSNWTPCHGEQLACSIDGVVGLLAVVAVGLLTAIVFGIALYKSPRTKSLAIALMVAMLPVGFLLYVTVSEILIVRDGASFYWREYQKLLQIVVSPVIAVVLQWAIFQTYLSRKPAV